MELSPAQSSKICTTKSESPIKWKIKPILTKELTEELPLEDAFVGTLKNKQCISKAITSIPSILPTFNHLKRCNGTKMLLAWVKKDKEMNLTKEHVADENSTEENDILSENELKQLLTDHGFDLSLLRDRFEILRIPLKAARTKAQAKGVSKLWPMKFHPDMCIEEMLTGSLFTDKLLESIEAYMKVVVEASKMGIIGTQDCGGSAMIVDPLTGKVLALTSAKVDQHPLWHASMLAIDLVARQQGGGAWSLVTEEQTHNLVNCQMDKVQEKSFEENSCGDDVPQIEKSRKRKYSDNKPLFYPESLKKLKLPEPTELMSSKKKHYRNKKIADTKEANIETSQEVGPYLCTGYWAFLLQEPCSLCAMALLHSRISKIFYCMENKKAGVLGSKAVLHALPGLNHRYQVWGGILQT